MNLYDKKAGFIIIFLVIFVLILSLNYYQDNKVSKEIEKKLTINQSVISVMNQKQILLSSSLYNFYENRKFSSVWVDEYLKLPGEEFIDILNNAEKEGLRPQDYYLDTINLLIDKIYSIEKKSKYEYLAKLDILLTEAYFNYCSDLLTGKTASQIIEGIWTNEVEKETEIINLLEASIQTNDIRESLSSLTPQHQGYYKMRSALLWYRIIEKEGGWPVIPGGPILKKGDLDERVSVLRKRLAITGDLVNQDFIVNKNYYDDTLEKAVRRFQYRQGLIIDGIVGESTRNELNIPVEERVKQLEINMERWRWLPEELGSKYVLVNIADFKLDVVENNQKVMSMKAIVGSENRRTPVFSNQITYVVLNPYWYIPNSIAVRDKLPLIKDNIDYLKEHNIRVFQVNGNQTRELKPESINWSELAADNFELLLRQEPGPDNALGRVKFMFPNKYNVYLHDTPIRELFDYSSRSFSSGCIRLEKPLELAEYLLNEQEDWNREKILQVIETGKEEIIYLKEPVTVHLLYWTAWVDKTGMVLFRKDIYRRDETLREIMYQNNN